MSQHLLNNKLVKTSLRAQLLRDGLVKADPVREQRRLKGLLVVRRLDAVLTRRSMVHNAKA